MLVKQWNSDGRTVWNSETVEQCGGTVWWNSGALMVEQWNNIGGKVWWNSATVMVEQCGETVRQ